MSNRSEDRTGQKRTIRLRTNILTIFLAIFLVFSTFLIWFNYRQNTEIVLESADRLLEEISDSVIERMRGLVQPLYWMAEVSVELSALRQPPHVATPEGTQYLVQALRQAPHVLSFFVGFDNGDFFQVKSLLDVDAQSLEGLKAPEGAQFMLRRIISDSDGERDNTFTFYDADLAIVGHFSEPLTYDPRKRPWYVAASDSEQVISTKPYVFAGSGSIGLTVAKRFMADIPGVFGADMTLASLSDFLDEQRLSPSTRLLIYDSDGNLLAHHHKHLLVRERKEEGESALETVVAAELEDPVVRETFERAKNKWAEAYSEVFFHDGVEYLARVTPITTRQGDMLFLAGIVPVLELVGPLAEVGLHSVLITLAATLVVIWIVVFAARRISRPLGYLAVEAEHIRSFQLEKPVRVDSRVREVQRLAEAMDTSKTALRTFSRYVPKDLVRQLIESGEVAEIGGRRRPVTLMFTDIAGFTTIVEEMPPDKLIHQMSEYLEELGGAIMRQNGTIDKYIGDAIMAFWNAPLEDDAHARHACLAALDCRLRSNRLNDRWRQTDKPVFATRIGVHSGDAVIGNFGSSDRMDYTAIGDSVNIASRLEGLNKFYGTQVLVSESVVLAVGDGFLMRCIDRVQPKGATRPLAIFELLGSLHSEAGALAPNETDIELCRRWQHAREHYESRDWAEAAAVFSDIAISWPNDQPAAIFAARTAEFAKDPPPAAWNGVEVLDRK